MSYQVIARKWRPMVFEDVVGQEHVTTTLRNAIVSKRIGHAYIFSGPRGVGKTTSARILAKAINCETGGPTPTPCNTCGSCVEITAGRALDVLEIDGASNRGIEEIRNLRETIRFLPVRGRYKVYIIDEFHMITKDAFNALLKTLEEPPAQVIFIFATTEPHKVLPTILSRCQRLDFKRVPVSKVIARLQYICDQEKLKIDRESLFALAQQADGGMRDAMTLLDQVLSFSGETISIDKTRQALGLISQSAYFEMFDAIHSRNPGAVFRQLERVLDAGWDPVEFLQGLLEHVRNLLVQRSGAGSLLTDVFDDDKEKLESQAGWYSETDFLRMMNLLTESHQKIRWSMKQRTLMELTLLKLAFMDDAVSLDRLLNSLTQTPPVTPAVEKKKSEPEPVVTQSTAASTSSAHSPPEEQRSETIFQRWMDFVELVRERKIRIGSILQEAKPVRVEGDTLTIALPAQSAEPFHVEILERERDSLTEMAESVFGRRMRLRAERRIEEQERDLFDSYPLADVQRPESETSDLSENFARLRKLEQAAPLLNLIRDLDCELIQLETRS